MKAITKQQVQERLAALNRDRQALANRITAVEGAIMDCEYWLALIAQAVGEDAVTPAAGGKAAE